MAIPVPPAPHARVIFVGVGQGDCTLIVFPDPPDGAGEVVLIDCGSTKGARCLITTPTERVVDALTNVKHILTTYVPKKTIDHLFITHADEDHYNLLVRALQGFTVKESHYTGVLEDYQNDRDVSDGLKGATYRWLRENDAQPLPNSLVYSGPPPGGPATAPWQYGRPIVPLGSDEGLFVVAANATGTYHTRNDQWQKYLSASTDPHEQTRLWKQICRYDPNPDSLVLALVYKQRVLMLMGDATKQTEDFIRAAWGTPGLLSYDITLKMGHHGSDTSSSERWVKLLKPRRLTVSSGTKYFNGSGIPKISHLDQVERWSGAVQPAEAHEYTYFDDRAAPYPSFLIDHADQSIFTSQLMVNPLWTDRMPDEERFICGTWHLTLDAAGNVMIGY